jgi:hypothetical protein
MLDYFRFFVAVNSLCLGCATTNTVSVPEERERKIEYNETINIATEPPGCRVYFQENYRGVAPLEVKICALGVLKETRTVRVKELNKRRTAWQTIAIGPIGLRGLLSKGRYVSETAWSVSDAEFAKCCYEIAVFDSQGRSAHRFVDLNVDNGPVMQAVMQADTNSDATTMLSLPPGTRNVLVSIPVNNVESAPSSVSSFNPSASSSDRTTDLPHEVRTRTSAELDAARQEYDSAKSAYDKALADLTGAQVRADLNANMPRPPSTGRFDNFLTAVVPLASRTELTLYQAALQEASVRLQGAQKRLEIAEKNYGRQ